MLIAAEHGDSPVGAVLALEGWSRADPNPSMRVAGVDRGFFDQGAVVVARDSSSLGWDRLYAAVAHERPHEAKRPSLQALWLTASLSKVNLRRFIGGREHYLAAIPPNALTVTPPGEGVRDVIGVTAQALHLFIGHDLVREVAVELMGAVPACLEVPPAFSIDDPALMPIVRAVQETLQDTAPESRLQVDYLARALVAHVLRRYAVDRRIEGASYVVSPLTPRQMQAVHDYIRGHLTQDISVAGLADVVGLSRAQFLRRFKAASQSTPYQAVMAARVQKAKELLADASLSLADVAVGSGFASQTHFASMFSRSVKVSPSAYRRRLSNGSGPRERAR